MKKLAAAFAVLVLSAGPLMAGTAPPPPAPVPEPTTIALLAGGAALLGAAAWRSRNKR